ncbi:MAG: FAD-dependent monooxygenase [Thiotrichales bacterium]|nr:FAD-dependent monooxygenase [Thiotrichales bacterium]
MQATAVKVSDILIVGGGPVGLMLALGLAKQGFAIGLLEANPAMTMQSASEQSSNAFDGRVLALSYGSIKVLQQLGVWASIKPFATAIEHVHVSQKGYLGITTLHAEEMGVSALGYSVQGRDLGRVLWQAVCEQVEQIQLLSNAKLLHFEQNEAGVEAQVQIGDQVHLATTQFLIGADGTQSQVRQGLGIELLSKDYEAVAILAQIQTAEPAMGWSYERFTQEGPVAILPMQERWHKAVMVCPKAQLPSLMSLDDAAFLARFTEKMGARMGGFVGISPRLAYPLHESYVQQIYQGRVLLMGNAAHTQHPVAAQGLNLGIRDVAVFLQQIAALNLAPKQAIKSVVEQHFLHAYAEQRQPDHQRVLGMTDGLIDLFQHSSPLVGHLRGIGLMAMQALPPIKKRFARFAMGKA